MHFGKMHFGKVHFDIWRLLVSDKSDVGQIWSTRIPPFSGLKVKVVEIYKNSGRNPSTKWRKVFVICQPLQSCECIQDTGTKIHLGSFEGESHFVNKEKLIWARLSVSRPIYVNIDSPNLGFPYLKFLGERKSEKTPCIFNLSLPSSFWPKPDITKKRFPAGLLSFTCWR